jgi:hypothetical protein
MDLTPEEAGKRAWLLVQQHYSPLRERYLSENETILDSDRAKELFPEYAADLVSRRRYASAVYPPAAAFIDRLYGELLREPVSPSRHKLVVFMAGGNPHWLPPPRPAMFCRPRLWFWTGLSPMRSAPDVKSNRHSRLNSGCKYC